MALLTQSLARATLRVGSILSQPSLGAISSISSTHCRAFAHASEASQQPIPLLKEAQDAPGRHFRNSTHPHPLYKRVDDEGRPVWVNPMGNQVWSEAEVHGVKKTHVETKTVSDKIAYGFVKLLRGGFDILSGYAFGPINESKFLRRAIFLETVAGIPGMVAGAVRHLQSLRLMRRDHGWINTLLEEAENERMHLLTFLKLQKPGILFRSFVFLSQGIFWNLYFFTYIVHPKICHRFVGYLEEEAVKTYTDAIAALDNGQMPTWTNKPAPNIAKTYWGLSDDALMRCVLLAVRADEAHHRDVNHTFSDIPEYATNPYITEHDPSVKVDANPSEPKGKGAD